MRELLFECQTATKMLANVLAFMPLLYRGELLFGSLWFAATFVKHTYTAARRAKLDMSSCVKKANEFFHDHSDLEQGKIAFQHSRRSSALKWRS